MEYLTAEWPQDIHQLAEPRLNPCSENDDSANGSYTSGMDKPRFLSDELVQDAVVRRIAIIGEAVSRLPESLKQQCPDIPWQDIKGMRNKLIHDYGHLDPDLVWELIQKEIPALEGNISRVLEKLG